MDFKELVALLRRRWMSIVAVTMLALVIAAGFSYGSTAIYQSKARVFISTDTSNAGEAFFASAFTTARVKSYADLVTSGEVMREVIDRLDLDLTPSALAAKTSASVQTDTVIIVIEVRDEDPRKAQEMSQATAETLTAYLDQIETPKGKSSAPIKATVTDRADFSDSPVSPNVPLNMGIAGALGLMLGIALALVRDVLDTTLKTNDDVKEIAGGNDPMAHIAYDPDVSDHPLISQIGTHDPRAEAFRMLRTNLQFLDPDQRPNSFVITSAVPGEGKTSVSTNLAIALAQAGHRVLIVDGDLRRPRIAPLLGLESAVGLTTVLVGQSELDDAIQLHTSSGVHVLASGPLPPNPTEILQSHVTQELFDRLRASYDFVIIDAPPLLPVADAAIQATYVDGAFLVVRHSKTTKDQLTAAVRRIDQVGARLFGTVINMVPKRGGYGGGYGYGYGYEYAPATAAKPAPKRAGKERRSRVSSGRRDA